MKRIILLVMLCPILANSQAIINKWMLNANGQKATYYAQTGTAQTPVYTFTTSTDSADVLKMCYTTDTVWTRSQGLTTNMGKYLNPGYCSAQNYTYRFPRNPVVAGTKTISPKEGPIGLLLNGVPIYGLSNANSWNGSTNTNNGSKVWNVEVGKSEGFVLDTAFGAHPQQQGAYHTHTTPFRLYKNTATTIHSPLVGFAFDGYPIYGPYGYSVATNASSAVARMKTGYSLRNITARTTLPYSVAASQTGPAVSTTYPIGTYCEDYEWLAANGGNLDKYNGRYCVTPDYPSGTYAYFVTIDATGKAAFPYYIGIEYYGTPDTKNFAVGMSGNGLTIPAAATSCLYPTTLPIKLKEFYVSTEKTNNKLSWITTSEFNVSYFFVERSKDGNSFETIGKVDSKGNSSNTQTYQFIDESPLLSGFYRLKSIEKDGTETISSIINLTRKEKNNINIYPTNAKDFININSQSVAVKGTVKIYNVLGIEMLQSTINIEKGATQTINISKLNKGMFYVLVEGNGEREVVKIFKGE